MVKIRVFLLFALSVFSLTAQAQNFSNIYHLVDQQQYAIALKQVDQKLISNANNQELLLLKAQLESKLNSVNQAIKSYKLLITLYPLFPEAYNNLAGIYAKQGKLQLAKQTLINGINTNKSYALIHNNIKNINFELARESYVKALQLGVKKHNVELDIAKLSSNNISIAAVNKNTIKPSKKLNKVTIRVKPTVEKNTVTNKVNTRRYSIGPRRTVPRIKVTEKTNKKIVIKTWSESVISVKYEVITALKGWAAAWSAQDVDLYLSFYDKQFLPENGSSRKIWISQRQTRLLKPRWIEVRLSDFIFEQRNENQAEVEVTQLYRSNSFRDSSKKKFLLKRSDDGWQILNEINF